MYSAAYGGDLDAVPVCEILTEVGNMHKYVLTVLFVLLLAGSAAVFLSPADTESIKAENREIAAMPELTAEKIEDGSFASEFDSYVNDNIGFRGKLMELSGKIRSCFGFTPQLVGKVISTTADIGTAQTLHSSLMIVDRKVMEMFSNKPEGQSGYAEALNNISREIPGNVKMYSMIVPTQLEFEDPLYSNAQDSQKDCIESIDRLLAPAITPVDAYSRLEAGTGYLYFKTDHHWTMDGAYCGYEAFMDASGGRAVSKDDFQYKEESEFYGALYQKARSQMDKPEADTLEYYDVAEENDLSIVMRVIYEDGSSLEYGENSTLFDYEKEDYTFFLGGDQPLIEITNNLIDDGKTIIVIKDSYANALVPWLVNNYKQVILIDPRSFEGSLNEEIERYEADELAVVNYVFTTTFSDYCELLNGLVER